MCRKNILTSPKKGQLDEPLMMSGNYDLPQVHQSPGWRCLRCCGCVRFAPATAEGAAKGEERVAHQERLRVRLGRWSHGKMPADQLQLGGLKMVDVCWCWMMFWAPFTNHQYLLHIVQALRMIINPIAHETFNKAIRHKTQKHIAPLSILQLRRLKEFYNI